MPRGGFDLSSSVGDVARLIEISDAMKQRRLQRENPLAATLSGMSKAEGLLGETELEERTELFSQLMRLHGVEDPEQIEKARGFYTQQRSKAKQARIRDLQQHLGNESYRLQEQSARNKTMSAILRKSDPALADMM